MKSPFDSLSKKDKGIVNYFKLEIEEAYLDRFWRTILIKEVKAYYTKTFPHLKMFFA